MLALSQLGPLPSVGQQAHSQCSNQGKMHNAEVIQFLRRVCNYIREQTGTTSFTYSFGTL